MIKKWWESSTCLICDYWWILLILFVLLITAFFTRGLWMPVVAAPDPTPIPTEQVLGTGDVAITLRWQNANDIDLHVIDPNGEEIYYSHPASASNGILDVDSYAGCEVTAQRGGVENIYWPTDLAPHGKYLVLVEYYQRCDLTIDESTEFTVRVLVDGVEKTFTRKLDNEKDRVDVYQFDR